MIGVVREGPCGLNEIEFGVALEHGKIALPEHVDHLGGGGPAFATIARHDDLVERALLVEIGQDRFEGDAKPVDIRHDCDAHFYRSCLPGRHWIARRREIPALPCCAPLLDASFASRTASAVRTGARSTGADAASSGPTRASVGSGTDSIGVDGGSFFLIS